MTDLRSDETKYLDAEIARAVMRERGQCATALRDARAEATRMRSYNEGLAKIQTGMEAKIERLQVAARQAKAWLLLPANHDLSGSDAVYIALDEACPDEQAPQAYKWICESCGTVSGDKQCDCTKFDRAGRFVPFDGQSS